MSQNKEGNTYFLLTMDCERVPNKDFYPRGPLSWQESERNIIAFGETALEFGYKVTYFAVPEAVEQHADIFKRLINSGHEVGLHLHPHTFRFGINEHLANLPYDLQFKIIEEARDVFEGVMGFPPSTFRAGYFSANQDTFRALVELGFKRGSSSIPGRQSLQSGNYWKDWPRHCRYVNSYFEVPLTVHYANWAMFGTFCLQSLFPLMVRGLLLSAGRKAINLSKFSSMLSQRKNKILLDLRIDECEYSMLRKIILAEIRRMKEAKTFPIFNALTHSHVNYTDHSHRKDEYGRSRKKCLKHLLDYLNNLQDITIKSTTLGELQNEYDRQEVPFDSEGLSS